MYVLPLSHHDRDGSVVIHLAKVPFTGLGPCADYGILPTANSASGSWVAIYMATSRFEPETFEPFARCITTELSRS